MTSLFEAAGGADGMWLLAEAWRQRAVDDEIVSHAFHDGVDPHHVERLAAYWSEALGGPPEYTARYGDESGVVRMHSGNGEHRQMDRRAIACFDTALADADLAEDEILRGALHDYFAYVTLHGMSEYPGSPDDVPEGLEPVRCSWSGLVRS